MDNDNKRRMRDDDADAAAGPPQLRAHGNKYTSDSYYVRKCYPEYYTLVMEMLAVRGGVAVTGRPGIGKSVFMAYVFEGYSAANPEATIFMLAYTSKSVLKKVAIAKSGNRVEQASYDLPYMYVIVRKHLEEESPKSIFLIDGPPESIPPRLSWVSFTSPNEIWLAILRKNSSACYKVYMPTWTLEELRDATKRLMDRKTLRNKATDAQLRLLGFDPTNEPKPRLRRIEVYFDVFGDFYFASSPRPFTIVPSPRHYCSISQDECRPPTRTLAAGVEIPVTSFTEASSTQSAYIVDDSTIFEMPMLQRNPDRDANGGNATATVATARLYAGTSSGRKISVRWILAGVVVGMALGIQLGHFRVSSVVAQWVSLPGDLFLRALKCLVVPYVFCSVAVAVGDIVFVGKVSVVGLQTGKIFVIIWVTSVALGLGVALLFRPLFRLDSIIDPLPRNHLGLLCPNDQTLSVAANGTVQCMSNSSSASFSVHDLNRVFKGKVVPVAALSVTDELLLTITPLVSDNIVASFALGQLLSIMTFAMVLGSIAGRNYFLKTRETNYLYVVLLQLRNTIFLLMEWTISLSPYAVVSMVAGSFAANQSSLRQFDAVYIYVLAAFLIAMLQLFVLLPGVVFLLTHCNPFVEMRKLVRAYIFAFACSSSLATAPVTLTCVRKGEICSQSLANFVISIGVTSNLSGVGFYIPLACIFIAESAGHGDEITTLRVIGLFALSLISCAGTPPIPASGLVIISTIYTTIFGVTTMPPTFAYVVAMDFVIDRFVTVCDVNDDVMALKVIAETTDETVTHEVLGERE